MTDPNIWAKAALERMQEELESCFEFCTKGNIPMVIVEMKILQRNIEYTLKRLEER